EAPDARRLAAVVVTVWIGVRLQQPAPDAPFARICLFLPALEHARHAVQGRTPGARIFDVDAVLIGQLLDLDAGPSGNRIEETVFESGGAPGRAKVEGDARCFKRQAVQLDAHGQSPLRSVPTAIVAVWAPLR